MNLIDFIMTWSIYDSEILSETHHWIHPTANPLVVIYETLNEIEFSIA